MKKTALLFAILSLLSCRNIDEKKVIPYYQEKRLSFLHLQWGYDKTNNWIKKPDNILMLHETFKKIGYQNLINEEVWTNSGIWYLDVKKSPKNLIDSLELTHSDYKKASKYYREFWQRRKNEGNDETVYQVVKEIKQIMIDQVKLDYKQEIVNDTLEHLISIEYPLRKITNEEANRLLDYLIEIGLHQSAYNLITGENLKFWDVKWDRNKENVFILLNESESYQRPWFEDDTK